MYIMFTFFYLLLLHEDDLRSRKKVLWGDVTK